MSPKWCPLRTTSATSDKETLALSDTISWVVSSTGKPIVSVFSSALVVKTMMVTTNRAPAVNPCITNGESETDIDSKSRQLAASYRIIEVLTENLLTSAEQVTPSEALDRTLRKARTVSEMIVTMSPLEKGRPLLRGSRAVELATTAVSSYLPIRPRDVVCSFVQVVGSWLTRV